MRHDAKFGLALGILVIGFAVAFCFPRQPARMVQPSPKIPVPISEMTLELLPIRAYQASGVSREEERKSLLNAAESSEISRPLTPVTIAGVPVTAADLAPVAVAASRAVPLQPPIAAVSPVSSSSPAQMAVVAKQPNEETVPSRYVVKAGDTLTGIATKVLGSSQRYLELFTANEDILTSPDDLKIGMELRIPRLSSPTGGSREVLAKQAEKSSSDLPSPSREETPFQHPPRAPWMAERPVERR